jgi:hypothetical protein
VLCIYVTLSQFDGEASFFTQLEIKHIADAIFLDSEVQSYLASSDMQEKFGTQLLLDEDVGKDVGEGVDKGVDNIAISKSSGNKRVRDDAELMPPPKKWSSLDSYDAIIIAGDSIDNDIGDPKFDWKWYKKNFPLLFDDNP